MAKQKTKTAASKTKKTTAAKQTKPAKKPAPKAKQAPAKQAKAPKSNLNTDIHGLIDDVTSLMNDFIMEERIDTVLTSTERRRLIGAGVRNYGFIDKAWDIARDNKNFLPPSFSFIGMSDNVHDLEDLRQLSWVLEKFLQAVNDLMLIKADASFRDALRVYNSLREQSRARVPGAEPLFLSLLTFFRRRRGTAETEPTMKELERDFMKLVHGKADGEIIIENETPKVIGGVHRIVDNVRTGRRAFKETAEAEIDEGTSTRRK